MSGLVDHDALRCFCARLFEAAGVPAGDAEIMAEVLVRTDLRGIHSHGVVRVPRYLRCIRSGGIRPDAVPAVLAAGTNFERLDACGGLGIPAAAKAMRRALALAEEGVVGVVTVSHSDHFGAAGHYAMMGAEQGMIGLAMSNTCPLMAVTGSSARVIGNNPFAYAIPAARYRAVLYDVCMSVVASGKIELAHTAGETIPAGWLLGLDGATTTDPAAIYAGGALLPFGEHKGYGLAVMVEALAGLLAGAGMLDEVKSWNELPGRDANTGHCFIAIKVGALLPEAEFRRRTDQLIGQLIAAPRQAGVKRIYYPGEIEFEREATALQSGIPLPVPSLAALRDAAAMVGVTFDLCGRKRSRVEGHARAPKFTTRPDAADS